MKKTEAKSTVLLKHHLKALKLPTMNTECEKIAARCAGDNADHLEPIREPVGDCPDFPVGHRPPDGREENGTVPLPSKVLG